MEVQEQAIVRSPRKKCTAKTLVLLRLFVEVFKRQLSESVGRQVAHGAACAEKALAPVVVNSKRKIQSLVVPFGENFHCCAACCASLAKYLLGPGESTVTSATSPE